MASQTTTQHPKQIFLSLVPFSKLDYPNLTKFYLSFFSVTSVVTQNTFKVCLGTFDFDCSLFFSRFNKKENETLPNFRLLDEPEFPGSFPHHCVLILTCYKLVVSLWIPNNKDQSASISVFLYCKLMLIKRKCALE